MDTKQQHTPYRQNDNLVMQGNVCVADCQDDETARRIVACVNACAGIATENLDAVGRFHGLASTHKHVMGQRDELAAALRNGIAELNRIALNQAGFEDEDLTDHALVDVVLISALEAVLAKVSA